MYIAAEGKQNRTIIARLKPRQDIVEGITQVIVDKKIQAGYIPVILTALKNLRIRCLGSSVNKNNPEFVEYRYEKPLDCFGMGTIALDTDGLPSLHIHFSAAQDNNRTISGHLVGGIVIYTTEIVLVELEGLKMTRKEDPEIYNIPLLNFE